MSGNVKRKVPAIRFKGFEGEWQHELLEKIASFSKGRGYSKSDLRDMGTPIILYGSLYTDYKNEIIKVKTFVQEKENSLKSKGNEVIVPASGETSEDIARASAVLEKEVIIGGDLNVIYPSEKLKASFLSLSLTNGSAQNELIRKAQGKSVVHIRNADLKSLNIFYPEKNEQQQISDFFKRIDISLSNHKKKLNKLTNLRRAMLQKMFPKIDETVPEVRFEGFSHQWEETSFSEIFEYERPDKYIVSSSDYSEEFKTPVLTANKSFFLGFTNEENVYDRPCIIFDDFTLDNKYVDFPFMVKSSALKILTIRNKVENDLYFSYHLLSKSKIEIMGHARHYIGVVQPAKVLTTSLLEQKMIGSYFRKLETLISLNKLNIEKINQIKVACLHSMFFNF